MGSKNDLTPSVLFFDFRLLLILFVSFRALLLIAYQPFVIEGIERGITAGGDFQTYYQLAALSDSVGMPFVDWWSEFPPVWSHVQTLLYQLQGANVSYTNFAMLVGVLMLIFEVGNLALVRAIGGKLYGGGTGMMLAWIYALLVAPLIFTFWTFEPLVAFFLLLGLWWLLNKRDTHSALAAGFGALIKFTPALLLGAVWRWRTPQNAAKYTAIALGLFALVYLPFFLRDAEMTLPSLTAQFNKASYQTVWALLDGNYRTGNFGPVEERLDPANANRVQGNPAVIPGWLRLAAAAGIGLFVFLQTRRLDDKGLVAFVGITLLIFFLQSQGWSPQWLTQIIPLVLLAFPTRNGVLVIVLLSAVTFAEYPFLFIRTAETGGEIAGALRTPFIMLVIARTTLLAGICIALYRRLRQEPIPEIA